MSEPLSTRYLFRIVRRSGRHPWRVETYYAEPPYGPGWAALVTGYDSADDARQQFAARWRGVTFDSGTTGTFPSQAER